MPKPDWTMKKYQQIQFDYTSDEMTDGLYQVYLDTQKALNKRKTKGVWIKDRAIDMIQQFVNKNNIEIKTGICHGVRTGKEVRGFRERFDADIIGTDIQYITKQAHCIVWDFHKIKDEWVDSFDFIYSNSLDHAYDPLLCLGQWTKCLKKNKLMVIEWSENHNAAERLLEEPFHAPLETYVEYISRFVDVELVQEHIMKRNKYKIIFGIKK